MKNSGLAYRIFPWMVLPEVFDHMAPGVASQNVYANAYGVLTEMDYLYHLPIDNQNPINFGFAQITSLDGAVGRTALFNNKNKAGIIFGNVDEITDAIGRCMFLPSNGVDGISVEDNLSAASFAYNVANKEAHYSSAGSAELVYDNQAAGNVIARAIITDLCQELTKEGNKNDAQQQAINWCSSEAVGIEEHGVNYLTDSLLTLNWPGSVTFDKYSDAFYVKNVINAGSTADYIVEEVKSNFTKKEATVKTLLQQEITKYLTEQNGGGKALAFLEALLKNINRSKEEMENEKQELARTIQAQEQTNWDAECQNIKGFFGKIKQDEADALEQNVQNCIATKRDLLRHGWAIQFYTNLETEINAHIASLRQLALKLNNVAEKQENIILDIQRKAKTESKFQIYLHADDVCRYDRPDVTTSFTAFSTNHKLADFIGMDENAIERVLWDFAKQQKEAVAAVNVTIEDKLRSLTKEKVVELLERLKHLASPMWNTNLGGYVTTASPLSGIFVVGCYDAINGILQSDYNEQFKFGSQKASFVTTRQTDRIMLYRVECYSPVYAINNVAGYKREAEEAIHREAYPVPYIDEQWHQRMEVEGFDVYPKAVGDTVLPNWVNAIVYGYIKYNAEEKTYYIISDKGDELRGGYLPLGARRDVAFDAFQNMGLNKEVDQRLKDEILEKGRPMVDSVMKGVKGDLMNYVSTYAQLSAVEADMVAHQDPAYQMVIDQLKKEVRYIKSLTF